MTSRLALRKLPFEERLMAGAIRTEGGCLLFGGAPDGKGYGQISREGRKVRTHRVAFELAHGEIPEGADVDHRCRVRLCMEPSHLRIASRAENLEHQETVNNRGSSKYRGVSWSASRGKWSATVNRRVNGKLQTTFLGRFDSEMEAAEVARAARVELFTRNDMDRSAAL